MARNVVAMTAKATANATAKAARASGAGAKRTTAMAVTAATMTPNGYENNKDGNSKNCFQSSYYHVCPFYNKFYHTYASLVVNISHISSRSCLCITLSALSNLFLFRWSP